MANSVSNFTISHPFSSPKFTTTHKIPQFSRISKWPSTSIGQNNARNIIKSVAAGGNQNSLDHLQRTNKYQPQQQTKNKTPQVTPIGLWDRFPTARTVQQMMDTMERIMDDPLPYSGGGAWPAQVRRESGDYSRGRTPWEIKEGEGDYKMRFDMPGMGKQDVKVWVEEKMLVVKAVKKIENGEGEKEEWDAKSYGKYSFRIVLPENIEYDKIKAEVKNGVLYIVIPKASVSSKIWDINVQ